MNPFDIVDHALLDSYTHIARLYQTVTGKHKNQLAAQAYLVGGAACGPIALGASSDPAAPVAYIVSTVGALNMLKKSMDVKYKMRLTENVPLGDNAEYANFIGPFIGPLLFLSGLFTTANNALGSYVASQNGDMDRFKFNLGWTSTGIFMLAAASGLYLERVDIEPPSGKSVLSRLQEYLNNLYRVPARALATV